MVDSASATLHRLLDIAETQPDRKRDVTLPTKRIAEYPFVSAQKMRQFHADLALAEQAGAIRLEWVKYSEDVQLERIRLLSVSALSEFLKRPLREARINQAFNKLFQDDMPPWLEAACTMAQERWARGKKAFGLGLDDAGKWANVIQAARILDAGLPDGLTMDYRQFGARYLGDSKLMNSLEGPLATLFQWRWEVKGMRPQDAMRELNLVPLEQPVLLRGPLSFGDGRQELSGWVFPYIGVPPGLLRQARFSGPSSYLLTIENLSSFLEHAKNIQDNGTIIYTAGYPTSALQEFYGSIVSQMDRPVFHWGDTDLHGFQILKVLQKCYNKTSIVPHLMDQPDGDYPDKELKKLLDLKPINPAADALIERITKRRKGKIEQEYVRAEPPVYE